MDGGSMFSDVILRCWNTNAGSQSDSEAGEELRKQADSWLQTLAIQ